MEIKLLNVGFGNVVLANRVIAIVSPDSAPMKRLKEDAKEEEKDTEVDEEFARERENE
jgi:regulator of extracellular matrix RemA (YlzA/DUF370 family)